MEKTTVTYAELNCTGTVRLILVQRGDAAESPAGTDIPADMTATGKEDDGSIRFEVVCTCPDCRARNKYFISAKMI